MFTNLNELKGTWRLKEEIKECEKEMEIKSPDIVVTAGFVRDDGELCVLMSTGGNTTLKAMLSGYDKE